jgi:hypothetical protein
MLVDIFYILTRLIAKLGNVGKTARIGANTYKFLQQTQPHLTHDEILYTIIEYRYKDRSSDKSLIYKHLESVKAGRGELGLDSIITAILMLEARYAENSLNVQSLFKQVIDEELLKKGLSKAIVYGKRQGSLMDSLNIDVISSRDKMSAHQYLMSTSLQTSATEYAELLENNDEIDRYINALYAAQNQADIANVVNSIIHSGYDLESFIQLIHERTDRDTAKDLERKLLSVKLPRP